jgi:osmoprotectant transport system permease protein
MIALHSAAPLAFLGMFGDAFNFIFHQQEAQTGGGIAKVGGLHQVADLALEQLKVTALALTLALAVAFPIGIFLGHRRSGEGLALAIGNAGRAIPELALIAFMAAVIGVGLRNLTIALAVLGIPPILTNTYVGVQQVNHDTVDAARGMGMTEPELIRKVELPLAVPTIMGGVRTATINIVATATIAPLAGVLTLGDFIISRNVYGDEGVLAGAILVALMALTLELALAGLQWVLTSPGLRTRQG